MIITIDPGTVQSAYVILEDGVPTQHGTLANAEMLELLMRTSVKATVVIEKVESFGMPVGAEVFETVYWSGRFAQAAQPCYVDRIGRKSVVMHLCGSSRAKDSNVRAALIDRYGGKARGVGLKRSPGPLYGISGDAWAALAVAVTWRDLHGEAAK